MSSAIINSIPYVFPAIVVLITAYLMLSSILKTQLRIKELEVQTQYRQQSLPIQLQAYERLVLFLERINPQHLINRLNQGELSAVELQVMMVATIRAEYEHNLTQQLYVSLESWALVQAVTEEMISIINQVGAASPKQASSSDLSKALLALFIHEIPELPTQKAITRLHVEAQQLF